jgi:hypothetical protein
MRDTLRSPRIAFLVTATVFALTVVQLLVGAFVPGLDQFEGKGFGYRLVINPVLMLIAPVGWWLANRRRAHPSPIPWWACALIMASFLFDVTGNTLDLYDSIEPFDNISHFVTWLLIFAGVGLMLSRADIRPRWVLVVLITSLGSLFAIGWEIGEYWTFIRRGTELDGAYEDTLSDELLGTAGALVSALVVERLTRRWR